MEKVPARLIKIVEEVENVRTFRFMPKKKIDFIAGQFVFLYTTIEGEEVRRPYSIASSPLVDYIELTIQLVENGKMTTFLFNDVKEGDILHLSNAIGKFSYNDEKKIVCVAGGCGIVPFRSIIHYCKEKKLNTKIVLFYSSRKMGHIIYKEEFDRLEKDLKNLKIVYTLTRETSNDWKGVRGRFNKEIILKAVDEPFEYIYFVCGPLLMVQNISKELLEFGINKERIKKEAWCSA